MTLSQHTYYSALLSGLLYFISTSFSLALGCFLAGVFIDLDHIIDYSREYGFPFKLRNFFDDCDAGRFQKLVLILHGWELVILIIVLAWYYDWSPMLSGISIGMTLHLLLDTASNAKTYRSYFFFWRLRHNFNHDVVFTNKDNHPNQ